MELRHLRYFAAVARLLHFRKAAEELHIAQPPLSRQIKQLEEELGFPLFIRTGKVVQLTPAGTAFRDQCSKLMASLAEAIEDARRIHQRVKQTLRVGYISSLSYLYIPKTIAFLREQGHDLDIVFKEMSVSEQVQSLHKGLIDIALVSLPVLHSQFQMTPLLTEPLLFALPVGHPAVNKRHWSFADLSTDTLLLCQRSSETGYDDYVLKLCKDSGFEPKTFRAAADKAMVLHLVAEGLGVAIVPQSTAPLRLTGIVYKHFPHGEPLITIAALTDGTLREEAVNIFLAAFRMVMRHLRDESEFTTAKGKRRLVLHQAPRN